MAVRALIIAIEDYNYVEGGGLAPKLPGTLKAGLDFKSWLTSKWISEGRAAADTELWFLSEPAQAGGHRATRTDIVRALMALKKNGRNATEEFFLFFSGHGFSFVAEPGKPADILISSDFVSAALSSPCCLKLDEIVAWLRAHLGPGRHYHFVDACRNKLDATQIQVGPFLPWDPQTTADAATFVMQSTVRGATAVVGGPFPATLLAGLKGAGSAKVWDQAVNDAMFVRYESLRRFVKEKLTGQQSIASRVDGPDGEGESEAILAKLSPVPLSNCTVRVVGASQGDSGELFIKRGRSTTSDSQPLLPPNMALPLEPDRYSISVRLQGATVHPAGPVPVVMYDDQTVVFQKLVPVPPGGPSPPPPAPPTEQPGAEAAVEVVVPPGGEFMLRNISTGEEQMLSGSERITLPHGRYVATLRGSDGEFFKREEVDLSAGEALSLHLAEWRNSVPHVSIAAWLPQSDSGVEFSESLGGAVADADLDLWLALVGGGRIIGSRGDYSKIADFPLHDFLAELPGDSPIYLLAGLEDPSIPLGIAVSDGPEVQWRNATRPLDMPGIWEAYQPTEAGQHLLSFRIGEDLPYTIATATLPNRATLVTLTREEDGRPRITQFVLPLGHLIDKLPSQVVDGLKRRNHLNDVRFLAQASRAFRKRRDLSKALRSSELNELLYAKWLDPIGSALAAYELIRRGRAGELGGVVENMLRYFPELPDSWALARLSGEPNIRARGVPLFLDGLRAFPERIDSLPLAAGRLDYTSTWTAWQAAVSVVAHVVPVEEPVFEDFLIDPAAEELSTAEAEGKLDASEEE